MHSLNFSKRHKGVSSHTTNLLLRNFFFLCFSCSVNSVTVQYDLVWVQRGFRVQTQTWSFLLRLFRKLTARGSSCCHSQPVYYRHACYRTYLSLSVTLSVTYSNDSAAVVIDEIWRLIATFFRAVCRWVKASRPPLKRSTVFIPPSRLDHAHRQFGLSNLSKFYRVVSSDRWRLVQEDEQEKTRAGRTPRRRSCQAPRLRVRRPAAWLAPT